MKPRHPATGPTTIPYGKIRTPVELGTLVRARRRAAGITQADASGLAGVGPRFMSELENGKSTVELGKVLQVLARLGLDLVVVARGDAP